MDSRKEKSKKRSGRVVASKRDKGYALVKALGVSNVLHTCKMILELRKDTEHTGPSYKCLRGNHGEEVEVTTHTA